MSIVETQTVRDLRNRITELETVMDDYLQAYYAINDNDDPNKDDILLCVIQQKYRDMRNVLFKNKEYWYEK